jgi:hypothetical protein
VTTDGIHVLHSSLKSKGEQLYEKTVPNTFSGTIMHIEFLSPLIASLGILFRNEL